MRRESPRPESGPATRVESPGAAWSGTEVGYARRESIPSEPAPEEGTARTFLARYHGADWPAVRARLEAAGVALDVPYVFHPWEEAEPLLRAGYRLAPEERAQTLEQKLAWARAEFDTGRAYPLGEEDLPVLRDLVADLNLELLGKAELYCDLLDVTLQERFRRGDYAREPYSSAGTAAEGGFHATAVGALGWATSMVLTREAHPELAGLLDEMRSLRQERRARIVRHLHAKIGR